MYDTSFDSSRQVEEMAYEWGDFDEVLEGIARAREARENKKKSSSRHNRTL